MGRCLQESLLPNGHLSAANDVLTDSSWAGQPLKKTCFADSCVPSPLPAFQIAFALKGLVHIIFNPRALCALRMTGETDKGYAIYAEFFHMKQTQTCGHYLAAFAASVKFRRVSADRKVLRGADTRSRSRTSTSSVGLHRRGREGKQKATGIRKRERSQKPWWDFSWSQDQEDFAGRSPGLLPPDTGG
ncbi:hypothetical protein F2P81_005543 [Scophthalmus maximus]|uniref:Uncharacterized protein n=1 Tax=Scophthalmus maximus TaxID=52904 RepID=A0A6A4TGM0_SCOMX|nr:hypothetical protein F2P81_005543 [Scophthalmus maximus]